MRDWKWAIALFGLFCVGLLWLPQDAEAGRCKRRYRCFTKKYCDIKPARRRGKKRKYRYRCNYRRYCKYYRVCKKKRRWVPPPPPPPPSGSGGNDSGVMDFGRKPANKPTVPNARLQAIVKQRLPMVFSCFKRQLRRDSRFTGARIVFTIRGDRGRVSRVSFEQAPKPYRKLARCIKRASRRWRFPRFNSSAFVVYPIFVKSG